MKCKNCNGIGEIGIKSIGDFDRGTITHCKICGGTGKIMEKKIRKFNTGAVRDTSEGKHDYEGYFSPLVIRAFGNYMIKHSKSPDGKSRESDNWQKGFGDKHFSVCIKSAWRHFLDLWLSHRGYKGRESIDEAICGLLFNIMAYYHQLLKGRINNE